MGKEHGAMNIAQISESGKSGYKSKSLNKMCNFGPVTLIFFKGSVLKHLMRTVTHTSGTYYKDKDDIKVIKVDIYLHMNIT